MNQLKPIFQVSECNELLSRHLSLLGEFTVEGEISQLSINQGKWVFITIKDAYASIDIFGTVFQLKNLRSLEEGMKVQVEAVPQLYKKNGKLSLFASQINPVGTGSLNRAFELLKSRLTKEGLFEERYKQEIPSIPNKIGLITAQGSEAYNDFVKVAKHRLPIINIIHFPVTVQGASASEDIQAAIDRAHTFKDIDALVITRGGGSSEDLAVFNDEDLIRKIFASQIPCICAIGHEGDVTLAELTADLRASTPSNAAEILVPSQKELLAKVRNLENRMYQSLSLSIEKKYRDSEKLIHRLYAHQKQLHQNIYDLLTRFAQTSRLLSLRLESIDSKLESHLKSLEVLHPDSILKKGYTITTNEKGLVIKKASQLKSGDRLHTQFETGKVTSIVE